MFLLFHSLTLVFLTFVLDANFDYFLSAYGAKNINKHLVELEASGDLDLIYPGHYLRLFKKSQSED